MALQLFGHLGFGDAETPFANPTVQATFYASTQELVDRYRADTAAQAGLLIERTTENFQEFYRMHVVGGMMQVLGGHDRPKARKGISRYTVGYPLGQFGELIADEKIGLAYMTVEQYDEHVLGIFKMHSARYRYEMMRTLFNNTSRTYTDPMWGQTTVLPLANNDGQTYPLGQAGDDLTAANHYIAAGYISSAISNTNNPYAQIAAKWTRLFPEETRGTPAIVFINSAEVAVTTALAAYTALPDPDIVLPITATRLQNVPAVPQSAYIIGRASGCWIAVWDAAVDPGYMLSVHPNVKKPIVQRVDTGASGLQRGLHLESEKGYDANWPFREQVFMDRFGFGIGNRLGAVVLQLTAGSYAPPARYAV